MPAPTPDDLLTIAVAVAREAGGVLADRLHQQRTAVETKSSSTDMVSEVDRASEALIARRLRELRPADGMLAEEGTTSASTSGVEWVADPLDGTTNYLYGFPSFAVSLAARIDGVVVAGAVHDPVHDETFAAARGSGASCNGARLAVVGAPTLAGALVGTGFAYDSDRRGVQARLLPTVLPAVRDIRRAGAASLDLCWTAAGRLDAYYEWGLAPWDWAAGALIAEEAGCRVGRLDDTTIVAAPPHLFDELVALLERARSRS